MIRTLAVFTMLALSAAVCLGDDAASSGPAPSYWQPDGQVVPGPLVAGRTAATGVWVSCDRWPDTGDLRRFAEDAVRLSDARTDQEKALAVWRWVRRIKVHTDGNPPINKVCGTGRDDDVVRVLNVYGAHYCGGLSRVACQIWRAYGLRADRVHSASHSMVDLYYADADGVTRPHLFDVNFGGYLWTHDRKQISGCEDWATGYNGSKSNWVHSEHEPWSPHRMELDLRMGERLSRMWGNEGKPYQDHMDPERDTRRTPLVERGPYTHRTYGNGTWTLTSDADWRKQLAGPPVNLQASGNGLVPVKAGAVASAEWDFRTPYIVSDVQVQMRLRRATKKDTIRLLLSTDDGKTWNPVWQADNAPAGDEQHTVTADICPDYQVTEAAAVPGGFVSPFGRYSFRVKLELTAGEKPGDCRVEEIRFLTTVQQNFYALPQLHAGRNRITVRGNVAKGSAVKVTYRWKDLKGERTHEAIVANAPFTYEIVTAAREWKDVVCSELVVEACPATSGSNVAPPTEGNAEITSTPLIPVDQTRGRGGWWQRDDIEKLRPVEQLVKDLADDGKKSAAIKALQEHRNPAAFDAVAKFARAESDPLLKDVAIVTLFRTDRERARPILIEFIEHPEKVTWTDEAVKKGPSNGNQHWATTAATIGLMASEAGWADAIPGLLKVWDSGHMSRHVPWTIMRVFSRIGDGRCAAAVRAGLKQRGYTYAWATLAAARLQLKDAIPDIRKVMDSHYRVWQQYAIVALGRLGDRESAAAIRERLTHWDENLRAASAEALGEMGDVASLAPLQAARRAEPFTWVRDVMDKSIGQLQAAGAAQANRAM